MKLLWGVLAAALAAWGLTLAIDPPASLDIWVVRKQAILLTGVASFALMSLIMLLAVRPTWLEKPLDGLDRMYRLHKWAGILAIVLGLLHYLLGWAVPCWRASSPSRPRGPGWKPSSMCSAVRPRTSANGRRGFSAGCC